MAAKKKTTKKSTAKTKKNLTNMEQTHGKMEEFQPSTLDQIWGDSGMSKYKTLKEEEYEQQLRDFSRADLQAHAVKVGLIPIDNSDQLRKRLLTEFRKYASVYKAPIHAKKDEKPLSKQAMKILNEGK